jgi:hypothetical protein
MHLALVPTLAEASTTITTTELVGLLVAVVLPLLVGLVTKASWTPALKSVLLAALSAVAGVAQGFLDTPPGVTWDWQHALLAALVTWVIAVATYFGLWKPTGTSDAAQARLIKDSPTVDMDSRLGGHEAA